MTSASPSHLSNRWFISLAYFAPPQNRSLLKPGRGLDNNNRPAGLVWLDDGRKSRRGGRQGAAANRSNSLGDQDWH